MENDNKIIGRWLPPDGLCLVLEHSTHRRGRSAIGEVAAVLISHTLDTLFRKDKLDSVVLQHIGFHVISN